MILDNCQHLVNLASEQHSKNYSVEKIIWMWNPDEERYLECYGRLRANLLFMFELNGKDSTLFGVYILEKFRVIDEPDSEALICDESHFDLASGAGGSAPVSFHDKFYRFSLLFIDSGESVRFACQNDSDKALWIRALSKASSTIE